MPRRMLADGGERKGQCVGQAPGLRSGQVLDRCPPAQRERYGFLPAEPHRPRGGGQADPGRHLGIGPSRGLRQDLGGATRTQRSLPHGAPDPPHAVADLEPGSGRVALALAQEGDR
jgi:hypothetical protein